MRQNGVVDMKKNEYLTNVLLIVIFGIICLAEMFVRTFSPAAGFVKVNIPFLVLMSAASIMLEYYLIPGVKRNWLLTAVLAGATFAVLPFCSGWDIGLPVWKMFLAGAAVFGVTDILYRSIGQRMMLGTFRRVAPVANAFVLYLASQCLQGLI